MRAGRLRHVIVLQQRVRTTNSTGEAVSSWTDLETLFASIRPIRGREDHLAQQVQAKSTHEIEIRFCPHITTEHCFVERTADSPVVETHYDIQDVIADERRTRQICRCTVRVGDGWRG